MIALPSMTQQIPLWRDAWKQPTSIRHVRGKSYVEKLRDCLRTIDTKYTIIVCDDDFLCFSGIPYSLQYLEENPDVVAVSGQEVAFVEPETTVCGDGLISYETIDYLVDF